MKRSVQTGFLVVLLTTAAMALIAGTAEYYVVIGTFSSEENARRYTTEVIGAFGDAAYVYNPQRQVYHVHVLRTPRKEEADQRSRYLKQYKGYGDAWVYVPASGSQDGHGVAGQSFVQEGGPVMASAESGAGFVAFKTEEAEVSGLSWSSKAGVSFSHIGHEAIDRVNERMAGPLFTFVVEDAGGRDLRAEVMLVDFEKAKKITSFRTGEFAAIRGSRREQMVTFVCDVLGYAQETRMFNIDHLSRGLRKNDEGIWEVRFKLRDMELHDIFTLTRTDFYKDAAVLRPSARGELDELVAMMRDHPAYRIVIHSHSGSEAVEIRVPQEEKDAFSLEGTVLKKGSAKSLTKARAALLKNYLVGHGIDAKRVMAIGWGARELAQLGHASTEGGEYVAFELVKK